MSMRSLRRGTIEAEPEGAGGSGVWTWEGSIIDGMGRITAAGFDGTYLYSGGDTAPLHRADIGTGKFAGYNSGVGAIGASYEQNQKHVAGLAADIGNPSLKVALVGDGEAGAILTRKDVDAKWTLATATYWGNATNKRDGIGASIPGSEPRQGGQRITVLGDMIWASVYKASGTGSRGIVRSRDAGLTWTEWRFDAPREYTGLAVSPNFRTTGLVVVYATHRTGGLTVCRKADHLTDSAFTVLDPAEGLTGVMALCVINEEGTDVVYVVNGCDDATTGDRGVWRCAISGPVTTGTAIGTWTKVSTGLPASTGGPGSSPTNWWTAIAGRRRPGSGGVGVGDPTDVIAPATHFTLGSPPGAGWDLGWENLAGDKTYGQTPPAKGRVSALCRVGDWIYIGGQFHRLTDQTGTVRTTPRHLVRVAADAVPANHGNWDSAWVPDLGQAADPDDSGWVKHIASIDPGDGNGVRLIVAGDFTDIGGTAMNRLACFRIASGTPTLDAAALPNLGINNMVWGVGVDGTTLYITGLFTSVDGSTRQRMAKLTWNGTRWILDPTWTPTLTTTTSLPNGAKYGSKILPVPSQDRVVIAGAFTTLNGDVNRWYMSAVNKTTGASVAWADQLQSGGAGDVFGGNGRNFETFDAILVNEGGSYYVYSGHGGTNMAAKWNATTGAVLWWRCTNGGVQGVGYVNGKPVFGYHGNTISRDKNGLKKTTSNPNVPQVDRLGLFMTNADGDLVTDWGPNMGSGSNAGPLKVWSISNNATHLYVGGDFDNVGGTARSRFAIFPVPTTAGGNVTELIVGNHLPSTPVVGTYKDYLNADQNYMGSHYRSTDSGLSWLAVSNLANVDMVVYGETEEWFQKDIQQLSTNNSRLGGSQYSSTQLVYDTINQIMLSAGKSGVWRCDNPWDATPVWQPMVSGLGGLITRNIAVNPSNNRQLFITDGDRPVYRWLQGGDDQAYNRYMAQFFWDPGTGTQCDPIYCLSYHAGVMWAAQKLNTAKVYKNTAPWADGDFSATGITAPGASTTDEAVSILAWNNGTTDRLLIMTGNNQVRYSSNGGSTWTTSTFSSPDITPFTTFSALGSTDAAGRPRFMARAGSPKAWMFNPHATKTEGGGLWYSANSGQSWTRIWGKRLTAGERIYGAFAQDPTIENKLYVSFDDGGVWVVTGADTTGGWLTDAGTVGAAGSPAIAAAQKISARKCGALCCDPTNGDLVVCVPVTDTGNIPDILLSTDDGTNFTSITDDLYPDLGYGPLDVAKVGKRIYVSLDGASIVLGTTP